MFDDYDDYEDDEPITRDENDVVNEEVDMLLAGAWEGLHHRPSLKDADWWVGE